MSQTARLDPHASEPRPVQYDPAAADRFFSRIVIIGGTISIGFGLITLGILFFGR
jgi:hypothetical protein